MPFAHIPRWPDCHDNNTPPLLRWEVQNTVNCPPMHNTKSGAGKTGFGNYRTAFDRSDFFGTIFDA